MTASSPLRLHWLDPRNPDEAFPDVETALADPDGLLAIGGDLSLVRLLNAYQRGIFPWYNEDEPILWWAPDPRTVFRPDSVKVSRSLRKTLKKDDYSVCFDRNFSAVLQACAAPREDHSGTWLSPAMQAAYLELHRRGYAHSVEIYRDENLIGGLYGVALGKVFFGESMFSQARDASKIALAWLARQLQAWDFWLIDCQVGSAHLFSLGAEQIPRTDFSRLLLSNQDNESRTGHWRFDIEAPFSAAHIPAS